jgi:hypothetical protein
MVKRPVAQYLEERGMVAALLTLWCSFRLRVYISGRLWRISTAQSLNEGLSFRERPIYTGEGSARSLKGPTEEDGAGMSMGASQRGTRTITKTVVSLRREAKEGLAHLLRTPLVCHCGCVVASG